MGYLLAFGFSCICGWYWIKGAAFMAFVAVMAWLILIVAAGGHVRNLADAERVAIGIAIACAPWFIRDCIRTDWRALPGAIIADSVAQAEQRKAERVARQAKRLLPRR